MARRPNGTCDCGNLLEEVGWVYDCGQRVCKPCRESPGPASLGIGMSATDMTDPKPEPEAK